MLYTTRMAMAVCLPRIDFRISTEIHMNRLQAQRRYLRELAIALALYILLLILSLWLSHGMASGVTRTLLLASPMLAVLLAVRAMVRQIRLSDEYVRKTTLEHLAVAAAVTAGCTFTYGFLEIAGLPRLSMFYVWPLMAASWAGATLISHLRQR